MLFDHLYNSLECVRGRASLSETESLSAGGHEHVYERPITPPYLPGSSGIKALKPTMRLFHTCRIRCAGQSHTVLQNGSGPGPVNAL